LPPRSRDDRRRVARRSRAADLCFRSRRTFPTVPCIPARVCESHQSQEQAQFRLRGRY
jgi:hypothetical protein